METGFPSSFIFCQTCWKAQDEEMKLECSILFVHRGESHTMAKILLFPHKISNKTMVLNGRQFCLSGDTWQCRRGCCVSRTWWPCRLLNILQCAAPHNIELSWAKCPSCQNRETLSQSKEEKHHNLPGRIFLQ